MSTYRTCTKCSTATRSITNLCLLCRPPRVPKRPSSNCAFCGTHTVRAGGICQNCARIPTAEPGPEHALRGGRFVGRGGIVVWKPWTPEECAERTRLALRLREAS